MCVAYCEVCREHACTAWVGVLSRVLDADDTPVAVQLDEWADALAALSTITPSASPSWADPQPLDCFEAADGERLHVLIRYPYGAAFMVYHPDGRRFWNAATLDKLASWHCFRPFAAGTATTIPAPPIEELCTFIPPQAKP